MGVLQGERPNLSPMKLYGLPLLLIQPLLFIMVVTLLTGIGNLVLLNIIIQSDIANEVTDEGYF